MRNALITDFLGSVKAFALARCLMACIELDVFLALQSGPLSRRDLMQRLNLPDSLVADAFFDMILSFQILHENDGHLSLSPMAQEVLQAYGSLKSWNQEMLLFYRSLGDLSGVLQSGRYEETELAAFWPYKQTAKKVDLKTDAVGDYSAVMDTSQEQISHIIVDEIDFTPYQHVIDFGGGYGKLAFALAEKYPHLKITVADLPAVCEETQTRIAAKGLTERIKTLGVDFLNDDLPAQTADAILFVRVLHDWDDAQCARILARTRPCLKPNGHVMVIEPIPLEKINRDPASTPTTLMLALLGGKRRSVGEHEALLKQAGYGTFEWKPLSFSIFKHITAQ